jgi:hypothetical protein
MAIHNGCLLQNQHVVVDVCVEETIHFRSETIDSDDSVADPDFVPGGVETELDSQPTNQIDNASDSHARVDSTSENGLSEAETRNVSSEAVGNGGAETGLSLFRTIFVRKGGKKSWLQESL